MIFNSTRSLENTKERLLEVEGASDDALRIRKLYLKAYEPTKDIALLYASNERLEEEVKKYNL
tara:strand:+ start:602 stop:790 length:189 start_codon:yes stop_codon:yes gene_type:complete